MVSCLRYIGCNLHLASWPSPLLALIKQVASWRDREAWTTWQWIQGGLQSTPAGSSGAQSKTQKEINSSRNHMSEQMLPQVSPWIRLQPRLTLYCSFMRLWSLCLWVCVLDLQEIGWWYFMYKWNFVIS